MVIDEGEFAAQVDLVRGESRAPVKRSRLGAEVPTSVRAKKGRKGPIAILGKWAKPVTGF